MLIDTHAHLTCPEMLTDVDAVVKRAEEAGVKCIINICTDEASLDAGLELSRRTPWIHNVAAATPHDVVKFGEPFFGRVEAEARRGTLVAIGETGLDYHYELSPKEVQKDHLVRYITLAKEVKLPVIFHCRDAFEDLFAITDEHLGTHPALLHCFTGTLEEAKQVIKRGWYLSISGIVTFKKSGWLREVAAHVPLDQLVIETDSPYLAPQKWRGKRNEPAYITETARVISEVRGISVSELCKATSSNALKIFI